MGFWALPEQRGQVGVGPRVHDAIDSQVLKAKLRKGNQRQPEGACLQVWGNALDRVSSRPPLLYKASQIQEEEEEDEEEEADPLLPLWLLAF